MWTLIQFKFIRLKGYLKFFSHQKSIAPRSKKTKELIEHGIVKINSESVIGLSEAIENNLEAFYNGDKTYLKPVQKENVDSNFWIIPLHSKILWDHVFNQDLFDIVSQYLGADFYLDHNPVVNSFVEGNKPRGSERMHVDGGIPRLNVMINITNVTPESTHMVYLAGSHKRIFPFGTPSKKKQATQIKIFLDENPECVKTTFGSKDSIFVFNNGTGYHQKKDSEERRVVVLLGFTLHKLIPHLDVKKLNSQSKDYWLSEQSADITNYIKKSPFNERCFDLVFNK